MDSKEKKTKTVEHYSFKHSMPVQIRFNDIDTLGHVNNSVYFPFYDLGKANYFNAVKNEVIDWKKTDIVVANINCDFCLPIYFHEKIEVQTQVERIYDKSFKMLQRLINIETAEVKCVCTTVMVGFDTEKGVSAPLSKDWKVALAEFEGRVLEVEKVK